MGSLGWGRQHNSPLLPNSESWALRPKQGLLRAQSKVPGEFSSTRVWRCQQTKLSESKTATWTKLLEFSSDWKSLESQIKHCLSLCFSGLNKSFLRWTESVKLLTPLLLFLLTCSSTSCFADFNRLKSINVFYGSNKKLFPYRISPNWAPVYKQKGPGLCFSLINKKPWMWSSPSVKEPNNWQSGHSWQPHQ